MTLKPGLRSLKFIGTDTDRSATYDFRLTFHSNHGPISYRFRNKRRFQSKIANFSQHPYILRPRWRGSPWNLVSALGGQKLEWLGYWAKRKKFGDIFNHVHTIHQRDRRTDTGRQQKPRLRIASRGKKKTEVMPLPDSQKVSRYVHLFRYNATMWRTDRQRKLLKQYRHMLAMHADAR